MRIRYSAVLDGVSGYLDFARGFLKALREAGVDVDVYPIPRMTNPMYLAYFRRTMQRGCRDLPQPDVNLINATPDRLLQYRVPGAVNLGFTMFETSRLPRDWVDAMNQLDGVIVPCQWNREVFRDSGVHVPIHVVPPGIDLPEIDDRAESGDSPIIDNSLRPHRSSYKFYSIFQYLERKNPAGLLKAYFAEFTAEDDVCLVLKAYYSGFRSRFLPRHETRRVARMVDEVRRSMRLRRFPPVQLIVRYLSGKDMMEIHRRCDCFVLPHRAEGWGMPHMTAMAHGKPVITTGYSGNMDFMSDDTAWLLPYQLTPVCNMPLPWYEGDMLWAEPDLHALRKAMRHAFENPEEGQRLGARARTHISTEFTWRAQIEKLVRLLDQVVGEHRGGKVTPISMAASFLAE